MVFRPASLVKASLREPYRIKRLTRATEEARVRSIYTAERNVLLVDSRNAVMLA